jgi:hypothetical protein
MISSECDSSSVSLPSFLALVLVFGRFPVMTERQILEVPRDIVSSQQSQQQSWVLQTIQAIGFPNPPITALEE